MAAETLAEVLERMRGLGRELPRTDGVACFTRLYLAVTEAVVDALPAGRFRAGEFMTHLDVRFANLYFAALADPPRAWVPLFEARTRKGVAAIQFALAGMNAHINRDLPIALVETCQELGIDLRRDGPEHVDFVAVNALLHATEARVKQEFLRGPLAVADEALCDVDDVIAMWNVERARDAAWTNAETLWQLRDTPDLAGAYLVTLDRMVGFAGRGLLRPVGRVGFFDRIGRKLRRLLV